MKKALITGITGQDGSYLAEFLLEKGYQVHGIKRRSSSLNTERLDHIYQDPHISKKNLYLHYGDLTDSLSLIRILETVQPDEVYNLGAQSHVAVSFQIPEYTADVDGIGTLRILEALRTLHMEKKVKFYQAASSELFGLVQEVPQNESTPFHPRSPYAVAKLFAYWITINYRESYGMYACNGILFNHESERRGETFVTRKITRGLCRIFSGLDNILYMGNLDAKRDWGHAKDYVEMMWKMMQLNIPDDFVIASGRQISVRKFIELSANQLGFNIEWQGYGMSEIGVVGSIFSKEKVSIKEGQVIIKIDENYFRPAEVETLLGSSLKAKNVLNWMPKITIEEMVSKMVKSDLKDALAESFLKERDLNVE